MSTHETPTKAEVISDALLMAANKLALEKLEADERRDKREFVKTVVLAMVVGLPAIIGAIGSVMAVRQIGATHDLVNSRMGELIEVTKTSSRAEGVLEGQAK